MQVKKTQDIYERVTERIIELLTTHQTTGFRKRWVALGKGGEYAKNPVSETLYRGINQLLLSLTMMEKGYRINRWITFNQVQELNGRILQGSKATEVVYSNYIFYDTDGTKLSVTQVKKMKDAGKDISKLKKRSFLKYYHVFNVEQCMGLPRWINQVEISEPVTEFEKNDAAEAILRCSGATINYQAGENAFYHSAKDVITLPILEQFKGAEPYYSVVFHEMAHWTGHKDRLNRPLDSAFGSPDYAFEELIADLTSAFLCASLGYESMITDNASYIEGWLDVLKENKYYIVKAASMAHKAADFIHRKVLEKEEVSMAAA